MSMTTRLSKLENVKLMDIPNILKNPIISIRYMELKVDKNGNVIVVKCEYEEQISGAT
jgi:uncharacterized membrane protein